jgi:hypothetical protein
MENVVNFPLPSSRCAHAPSIVELLPATNHKASTATERNKRLREERSEVWRKAEAATRYWRMMTDFYYAVHVAQREGVAEACRDHPRVDHITYHGLAVVRFREAVMAQLLTPAPLVAAVIWKRAAFARGDHHYTCVTAEQIEAAIEADMAWLTAHPARQVRPKPLAAR